MSEQFKKMKESRVFSRGEFEGLKADAIKQGIPFKKFLSKQVEVSGAKIIIEVLHTTDANPMNSANTNIYVISEEPLKDYEAMIKQGLQNLEEMVGKEAASLEKIRELETKNAELEKEIEFRLNEIKKLRELRRRRKKESARTRVTVKEVTMGPKSKIKVERKPKGN